MLIELQAGGATVSSCLDFDTAKDGLRLAFVSTLERIAQGLNALALGDQQLFQDGLKMPQVLK